jgi:hypothetical protein
MKKTKKADGAASINVHMISDTNFIYFSCFSNITCRVEFHRRKKKEKKEAITIKNFGYFA